MVLTIEIVAVVVAVLVLAIFLTVASLIIHKLLLDDTDKRLRTAAAISGSHPSMSSPARVAKGARMLSELFREASSGHRAPQAELLTLYRLWGQGSREPNRVYELPINDDEATALRERLEVQAHSRSALKRAFAVTLGGYEPTRLPIETLASMLHDEDLDVRLVAAAGLERAGTAEAANYLVEGLRQQVLPPERLAERLRYEWAVDVCLDALTDNAPTDGPDIRNWLARALGFSGSPRAVPNLMKLAHDPSPENRVSAVRALGSCASVGDLDVIALLHQLAGDVNENVRAQVMTALGEIGTSASIKVLALSLSDSSWYVRRNASQSLLRFGDAGVAALNDQRATSNDRYAVERAEEAISEHSVIGRRP